MKKISITRKLEGSRVFLEKVETFFDFLSDSIENGRIGKKDTIELGFSREEKQQLFEFFGPPPIPMDREVNLNESIQEDYYISPFEVMQLLRKHR